MAAEQSWVVTDGLFRERISETNIEEAQIFEWAWFDCGCEGGVEEDPLEMFQNALIAWPKRVHVVEKAKGQK